MTRLFTLLVLPAALALGGCAATVSNTTSADAPTLRAPAVPRMDMDLHLARVQQRWRYADDELAAGEALSVDALAHDLSLLPDALEGPPGKIADVLLDFFGGGPSTGGGTVEAVADDDGVLMSDVERAQDEGSRAPEAADLP